MTGTWSPIAGNFVARMDHAAARLRDGRVLVVGGASSLSSCSPIATAEIYDSATGGWSPTSDPPITVGSGMIAVALRDGRILFKTVLGRSDSSFIFNVSATWGQASLVPRRWRPRGVSSLGLQPPVAPWLHLPRDSSVAVGCAWALLVRRHCGGSRLVLNLPPWSPAGSRGFAPSPWLGVVRGARGGFLSSGSRTPSGPPPGMLPRVLRWLMLPILQPH